MKITVVEALPCWYVQKKEGWHIFLLCILELYCCLLDLDINIRDFNIPSYVHLYIFTEVYFHDQMIPSFLMEKQINFAGI